MKRKIILQVLLYSLVLTTYSCHYIKETFIDISEGTIEYKLEYLNRDASFLIGNVYPDKLIYKFKDNNTCSQLSAGGGLFTTSVLTNYEKKTVDHLVKMINKKYVLHMDSVQAKNSFEDMPKITYTFFDETKEIAGYICKKAQISFENNAKPGFYVYYTADISIQNANWCTPFDSIDGVLMEYQIKINGIEMKLAASQVSKADFEDVEFMVPKEYVSISKEEMDKIMAKFL
jgi:GLPGLI family protein